CSIISAFATGGRPGPHWAHTRKYLALMNKSQAVGRATEGCSALQSLLSWCRAGRVEQPPIPLCLTCPGRQWLGLFPLVPCPFLCPNSLVVSEEAGLGQSCDRSSMAFCRSSSRYARWRA